MVHFKQARFRSLLQASGAEPSFFNQVHVIFGGTGAVGGATALRILRFFDAVSRQGGERQAPYLIVTGHTRREVREFTRGFFGIHQRDHGCIPERLKGLGYQTRNGATIELRTMSVEPSLPEIRNAARRGAGTRRRIAGEFLVANGLSPDSPASQKVRALSEAIRKQADRPFSRFLEDFRAVRGVPAPERPFQSVVVTIPLASVATYQLGDLEAFALDLGISDDQEIEGLKEIYLEEFPEDLANVARTLAREVLVAHTTGVGGMYDEMPGGHRVIRLGFAHSSLGGKLRSKQLFAERLTRLYSERGIRMLVTAAAIGVDAILHKKTPPTQAAVRRKLEAVVQGGNEIVPRTDLESGAMHVYKPVCIDIFGAVETETRFPSEGPLIVDYTVKSGENGYFTVANADALYRVMRVASASELGFVLARTAAFGDDPQLPRFSSNICNYTESDYSRQVFDLLQHPALRADQLHGLQPKALQDLGSAKHQGEMHTLGLLILLHRLKTLDLSGVKQQENLRFFDPAAYFEKHSKPLTLEDVSSWDLQNLAGELRDLVRARVVGDIHRFQNLQTPSPIIQEAMLRIFQAVLKAVWTVTSLGSPILFRGERDTWAIVGPFVSPLDQTNERENTIGEWFRQEFRRIATQEEWRDSEADFRLFCEFHFANGFVDLRPQATLVTAHRSEEALLARNVRVFSDEEEFRCALKGLAPDAYFTTSGLLALLVRLRGLARYAKEMNLELGTANEGRVHFSYDDAGRALLVPGVVESFRMVSEGLEKNTGVEGLDGFAGYERV